MRVIAATLFFATLTLGVELASAQPLLPNPDQAPIGGGAALILTAGGAYAIKKIRDRRIKDSDGSDSL